MAATIFEFIINGKTIKTTHEKLAAIDIIRLAIEQGAVSGKPEDYVLQTHRLSAGIQARRHRRPSRV